MTTALKRDRDGKLKKAQSNIQAVMDTLELTSDECCTCGMKRYVHWRDKVVMDALKAAQSRLSKARESLMFEEEYVSC